jgi:hypothetical protein
LATPYSRPSSRTSLPLGASMHESCRTPLFSKRNLAISMTRVSGP